MEAIADLKMTIEKNTQQLKETQTELVVQHGKSSEKDSHITALERRVADAEAQRRELHNHIQQLKGNIRVMCRVRPVDDGKESAIQQPDSTHISVTHGSDAHGFTFDKVFGTS